MTVIWSGITEEGAVVPVQVTTEGKVVAVGDGPEGEYLKLTGGNLTGDLTVNEQITLATDGSATFAGQVTVAFDPPSGFLASFVNTNTSSGDGIYINERDNGSAIVIQRQSDNQNSVLISGGGTAAFAGNVSAGDKKAYNDDFRGCFIDSFGFINVNSSSGTVDSQDLIVLQRGKASGGAGDGVKFRVRNNGSATFTGDVVIGSRGEQWLIRESNGVAMLVQQSLRQPREKLRDLPNELDLIEAALSEIMEKLKMTPPAGWPVWDGSDNA